MSVTAAHVALSVEGYVAVCDHRQFSVVLTSPSVALLRCRELAFWNCVSRLRNAICSGRVVPGILP